MLDTGYLALFLVGLLGGTHCVGMCGGIVGALAMGSPARWSMHLAYNAGRIISYTLAGALVGTLGAATLGFDAALAHAPRDMNVEREDRGFAEFKWFFACFGGRPCAFRKNRDGFCHGHSLRHSMPNSVLKRWCYPMCNAPAICFCPCTRKALAVPASSVSRFRQPWPTMLPAPLPLLAASGKPLTDRTP